LKFEALGALRCFDAFVVCFARSNVSDMQECPELEALKAELADKKAMLAIIECGDVSLGGSFEDRDAGLRRRIAELELQLKKLDSHRL
jgi:hypothetical protein